MSDTKELTDPKLLQTRLPYHSGLKDHYGVDKNQWRVLTDAIYPAAQTVEAVIMVLSYCKARNLDPFKRPVHIVPIWSNAERRMIESVWPGIAELRTTAMRTKAYAGMASPEFGPVIEHQFPSGKKLKFPEWCRITVRRVVENQIVDFPGPTVYFLETYGKQKNTDEPNSMWEKRPAGQLEKCAEAAALRRAFPEEIGNEYTADEAHDRELEYLKAEPPQAPPAPRLATAPPVKEAPRPKVEDAMKSEPGERLVQAAKEAAQMASGAIVTERQFTDRDVIITVTPPHQEFIQQILQTEDEPTCLKVMSTIKEQQAWKDMPQEHREEVMTAFTKRYTDFIVGKPDEVPID